jgi:hypothetical protein
MCHCNKLISVLVFFVLGIMSSPAIDLYISRWNLRLSSYTLTLFSTAKLSGATSSYNGNIEIYVFLEKYLHDF